MIYRECCKVFQCERCGCQVIVCCHTGDLVPEKCPECGKGEEVTYRWAVIDRLAEGDRYDDPKKIVSRYKTHEAAEKAVKRLGCGDRYAIVFLVGMEESATLREVNERRRGGN